MAGHAQLKFVEDTNSLDGAQMFYDDLEGVTVEPVTNDTEWGKHFLLHMTGCG